MGVEHGQLWVAHLLVVHEHDPPHESREPDGRVLVRVVLSDDYRVRDRKKPADLKERKKTSSSGMHKQYFVSEMVAWVNGWMGVLGRG